MELTGNRNSKLYNGLETAIEYVWLLTIFLVPLTYDPFCLNPYYFVKSLVLVFLVCMLLGLVLAQWLLSKHDIGWKGLLDKFKRSPLQVAVLSFGLIWIISTACSIMPYKSLWGNLAGSVGLLPNISWIIFFLILSQKIRSRKQVYRALYALVLSSGILSLIGILQFFYAPWDMRGGRVLSIEGNPLSLSGFIAMVLPVTLLLIILAWYSPHAKIRKLVGFSGLLAIFALQAWCLVLAQYSITLLLFVIGIFTFFVLIGIFLQRKTTLGLSILSLLFIVLVAVALLGQMIIPENGVSPGESRTQNATVAEQVGLGTLPIRLQTWRCAIEVITQSPEIPYLQDNFHCLRRLIGYGPETFIAMSQTRFPPAWKASYTFESLVISQPENHYLYLALTLGILGLLAFLVILGIFFYKGFRYLLRCRERDSILLMSAFIAAIVQYCAHVFFDPSVITAELVFWLVLALTVAEIRIHSEGEITLPKQPVDMEEEGQKTMETGPGLMKKLSAVTVFIIFIAIGAGLTATPLLANTYIQSGLTLYNKDKNAAMAMYSAAVRIEPRQSYYQNFLGNLAYMMAQESSDPQGKSKLLSLSESAYQGAIRVDPAMAIWYYRLADVDVYWALNGNKDKFDDAIGLYEQADRIFPGNPVILNKWALALIFKGDYPAAAQKLADSAKSDPLWIQTSFFQGLLEIYNGDEQAAADFLITPVKDVKDISYYINFCSMLTTYRTSDINSVIGALKSRLNSGGSDWKGYVLLGITDIYGGDYQDSVQAFGKSAEIVPDEDITLLAGVVNAMLSNHSEFQTERRAIVGGLMDRESKIPGSN
jgi:tetratricopeptide (TPR) repeat protein/O-antigen ligase